MARTSLMALALLAGTLGADAPPVDEALKLFEAKVRPVLLDQCTRCHSGDKPKGGLRLDSRAGAIQGGDSGPALVPGNVEESPIVAAVRYDEDGAKMPPKKRLATKVADDIARWVKLGAPWPEGGSAGGPPGAHITEAHRQHWSFRPIAKPTIPLIEGAKSPIDAFHLATLKATNMAPNPPADRRTLIRRATYDLTGLPPSPEEVEAFAADADPKSYANLVDRLLASPRYGERWGRHWLDLVRYAETNSYERDGVKPNAWRYRDYVIKSLNDDKPFDRFAREQLAGDELPDGGIEATIATGYYRLGIWDDEPSDRDLARFDAFDDYVATTGQVFLGLTVDCARCHDHKLDPISQKDYYKLLSFFRNVNHYRNGGPTDEAPVFADEAARAKYEAKLGAKARRRDEIQASLTAVEGDLRRRLEGESGVSLNGVDMDDLRYRYYRDTWEKLPDFDALKPEAEGPIPGGRFDLDVRTRHDAFGLVFEGTIIVPEDGPYTFTLDSDDGSRLLVGKKEVIKYDGIHGIGREQSGLIDLKAGRLPIRLEYFQRGNGLGLDVSWSGPTFARRPLSAEPSKGPAAKPFDLAKALPTDGVRLLGKEAIDRYRVLRRELQALKAEKVDGEAALCVTEAGASAPETFVMQRGDPHSPGDKVEPGFLDVLGATPAVVPTPASGARTTGRRTALADWIASPSNPLTARVLANRVWQHHFGRGIVRSPSNFGLQGEAPTHPELLDWLAATLIEGGWRLKPLHRQIMLSDTYRMSSRSRPEALAADPVNDKLWRFDMRRLSAEEVRDSILATTGALNTKMYGPGVYPEIPKEVMAGQSNPGQGWGKSSPADQARRSIYVHAKRSLALPLLEGFDAAETDRSTPSRFATTQPTQALAMINGTFLNAQAGLLAERVGREAGPKVEDRVTRALRLVTTRPPTDAEVRRGLDLIASLEAGGASAEAALRSFCLVALNMNEFLYLD